MRDRFEIGL
jgi:hypothetical protein